MTKHPYLVFVESNTSGTGRLFCDAARRRGLRPVVLCRSPERYPFLTAGAAEYVELDTTDGEALDGALDALSRQAPLAGVYSTSDYFLEAAAGLARRRSLPGPDPLAVARCRNKWSQRQVLKQAGLASPRFALTYSVDEALHAAVRVGYPVIAKPVAGTGSIGVRLCANADELAPHVRTLLGRSVNERGLTEASGVVVESYVVGPEYSAEVFDGMVYGLTRKHLSPEPFFVELGHDFPVEPPSSVAADAAEVVERAVRALNLTWGPAHVEFKVPTGGAVIIEVNPRLAGGFIPELVRLARGADLIEETVKAAVGEVGTGGPPAQGTIFTSIRFITSDAEGRLHSFEGVEEAAGLPGVVGVECYKAPGAEVRKTYDFRDRLGHVLAVGGTPCEAAEAAALGLGKVSARITEA